MSHHDSPMNERICACGRAFSNGLRMTLHIAIGECPVGQELDKMRAERAKIVARIEEMIAAVESLDVQIAALDKSINDARAKRREAGTETATVGGE